MQKKFHKLSIGAFLLCCVMLFSGCIPLSVPRQNNIITGEWSGDTFANTWTNITFELPSGYTATDPGMLSATPGQTGDFLLLNDDQKTSISATYIDLSSGRQQEHTAEDYLNIVKEQLANSANKDYEFANGFESAVIAGEEYLVLYSEFSFKEISTEGTNYQVGYARKFENAIILFLVCYSDDTKDSAESFLSSVTKIK